MRSRCRIIVSILLLAACDTCFYAVAEHNPGIHRVTDFGAKGDGVTDDTVAFQTALDAATGDGGGVVLIPTGSFLIRGNLVIPDNVALEGVWRAPVRGEPPDQGGTVLLAIAGKGELEGKPFIEMHMNSTLKGVTIFYPEQIRANPPIPYPWTVQGAGKDNITILDVTMVNPYQAVDLGTRPNGRHLIRNLYAYALFKGVYINQCYDVGRLENIHIWPFWDIDPQSPLWVFTRENATAFIIGKTDGQMAHSLFSIFYKVGIHFIDGPIHDENGEIVSYAAGCGMYTNCYFDVTPCAVLVDAVMETAGVSFVNASIMSKIVVGPRNQGPVKFTGSGFWATSDLDSHAVLEGRGTVFFESCHFNDWDRKRRGAPCIDANNRRLIVTGCDFPTNRDDHQIVRLGPRVRSAVIVANTMPGGALITNNAPKNADIQIGLNAVEPKPNYVTEWLVLAGFPNPDVPDPAPGAPTRAGYDTDYLTTLGGEANATVTPDTAVDFTDAQGNTHRITAKTLRADTRRYINLRRAWDESHRVAYAFTHIYSDRDQTACFDAGMNDGGKVYVNGELVYSRFSPLGQQCRPGIDLFEAPLKKGYNPIVLKVEDGGGTRWEFVLEVYGEDGDPLRTEITP